MKLFNLIYILIFFVFKNNVFTQKSIDSNVIFNISNNKNNIEKKYFSILNLKLNIKPIFKNETLIGEEMLTISPYKHNKINNIVLNAQKMDILNIEFNNLNKHNLDSKKLKFTYDSLLLNIDLAEYYTSKDTFILKINYVANPSRIKSETSKAISENKGLYFINSNGKDNNSPTQIWTQGEPTENSIWFPITEQINQKFTQEIQITVPNEYKTISNGLLTSSSENKENNLRTDIWKLNLPHSPYLVFFAVGKWYEGLDSCNLNNKKQIYLRYFVEPKYEKNVNMIFGKTPQMIKTFQQIFQTPFIWPKYDQVVVRNFVSGAMENTTIVSHEETAQQAEKELYDENIWENVIAHELAHHWFGDLVTCKNWLNLTLNESFANYSEFLWFEANYGRFIGDYHRIKEANNYFMPGALEKKLVRDSYKKPQDVFDEVTYNKGGAILHMLRSYLGDKVFFKSLKNYLFKYSFKNTEVANLRIEFEEESGEDLNWFFNQWYFNYGNPFIDINHINDTIKKQVKVAIKQNLQLGEKQFILPLNIIKFENNKETKYNFWLGKGISNIDTIYIPYETYPDLISIDPEKNILMIKKEEKKLNEYIYQLKNSNFFGEKEEALMNIANQQNKNNDALKALLFAINDTSYLIRLSALEKLNIYNDTIKNIAKETLLLTFEKEKKSIVKAKFLELLAEYKLPEIYKLAKDTLINSPSAKINISALKIIFMYDSSKSFKYIISAINNNSSKNLTSFALDLYLRSNIKNKDINVVQYFTEASFKNKIELVQEFIPYLIKNEQGTNLENGLKAIIKIKQRLPEQYKQFIIVIDNILDENISKSKNKKQIELLLQKLENN